MPSMDVAETDNEIEITAELPGLEQKDIDISVDEKSPGHADLEVPDRHVGMPRVVGGNVRHIVQRYPIRGRVNVRVP